MASHPPFPSQREPCTKKFAHFEAGTVHVIACMLACMTLPVISWWMICWFSMLFLPSFHPV